MTVLQGQIARLPCSGIPDVIPGPPEITFQKEGNDDLLGIPGIVILSILILMFNFVEFRQKRAFSDSPKNTNSCLASKLS